MRFLRKVKYLGLIVNENQVCGDQSQKASLRKTQKSKRGTQFGQTLCLIYHFKIIILYSFPTSYPIWFVNLGIKLVKKFESSQITRIAVRVSFSEYNAPFKPLISRTNILSIQKYMSSNSISNEPTNFSTTCLLCGQAVKFENLPPDNLSNPSQVVIIFSLLAISYYF